MSSLIFLGGKILNEIFFRWFWPLFQDSTAHAMVEFVPEMLVLYEVLWRLAYEDQDVYIVMCIWEKFKRTTE